MHLILFWLVQLKLSQHWRRLATSYHLNTNASESTGNHHHTFSPFDYGSTITCVKETLRYSTHRPAKYLKGGASSHHGHSYWLSGRDPLVRSYQGTLYLVNNSTTTLCHVWVISSNLQQLEMQKSTYIFWFRTLRAGRVLLYSDEIQYIRSVRPEEGIKSGDKYRKVYNIRRTKSH